MRSYYKFLYVAYTETVNSTWKGNRGQMTILDIASDGFPPDLENPGGLFHCD